MSFSACSGTTSTTQTTQSDDAAQESLEAYMETMETGGADDKVPDPTAPDLVIVSIYNTNADGKVVKDVDGIEALDPQKLLDKLAEYGVVAEGTKVVDFVAEDTKATEETKETKETQISGPGKADSDESAKSKSAYKGIDATLELSELTDNSDKVLTEIANTFIENLELNSITITVDGKELVANQTYNKEFESIK